MVNFTHDYMTRVMTLISLLSIFHISVVMFRNHFYSNFEVIEAGIFFTETLDYFCLGISMGGPFYGRFF